MYNFKFLVGNFEKFICNFDDKIPWFKHQSIICGGNPLPKFNVGGVSYKTASNQAKMKVFAFGV